MNVGVPSRGDIRDDRIKRAVREPTSVDLSAHQAERKQRPLVGGRDLVAFVQFETPPSRFRQSGLVQPKKVRDDVIQGSDDRTIATMELDAGMRRESFGAAHVAVPMHEHDRLVLHVDAQASGLQSAARQGGRRVGGVGSGHSGHCKSI